MTKVNDHKPQIHNDNLKNLKPIHAKKNGLESNDKELIKTDNADVSNQAKNLKTATENEKIPSAEVAQSKATEIAKDLAKIPVVPIAVPRENTKLAKKIEDKIPEKLHYLKKPAVIFIEGFSAFGISNGDGIDDMALNFPGAKKFDWTEKEQIVNEIKKHSVDQPVVLVGHSFGGDTAVEVANELNSAKNSFRTVDLLVSLDSVGFNNNIIPINVKRNLNFFQEGVLPFLHGSANIARNTEYTEVINELRNELHSRIDDSPEVQYKIFENINKSIQHQNEVVPEIYIEIEPSELLSTLTDLLNPLMSES